MRLRILVNLSLLSLAGQAAWAQTLPADEFFHSGAQAYLTNNIARAREEVDNGLKNYPDDLKLKKLDELLKQQSQQQQQSKNDQQKQEQKKDEQQKQQAKQDPKDQKDQQKQQGEKQSPEEKDKQKQEQQSKSSGEKKDEDKQSPQPMQAHAMTPKEAQQLLDAQKGEEQFLQFKPAERAERPARPFKDW
jgi:Ca-activated chloride channel family protein